MNETGQDPPGASPRSADPPQGADPLHGARNQGIAARWRHGSRRMRILVTAGAVTAAAAAVTTALLAASGTGAASVGAPSALAAVTSALAKTAAGSYGFSLDSSGQGMSPHVVSGMVDPGHDLGAELLTTTYKNHPVTARILFIGDYVYTWVSPGSGLGTAGKPWNKAPVPPPGPGYGYVSDQPVSPAELSGVLRYAHAVHDAGPASGPGWTGTKYTFTAHLSGPTVTATVYVDRQGRVRRLITTVTFKYGFVTRRDITFGDFGAQQAVTAPPASQIKYTSYPYWGFYF